MTLSARALLASAVALALIAFPSAALAQNGGPVQGHDGPVPFLDLTGKATVAAPTTASTGRARIFFDTTKGKLQQSISNGAWADLSGGGGGSLQAAYVASSTIVYTTAAGTIQLNDAAGKNNTKLIEVVSPANASYTMYGSDALSGQAATGLYFIAGLSFSGSHAGAELDLAPGTNSAQGEFSLHAKSGAVSVNSNLDDVEVQPGPTGQLHVFGSELLTSAAGLSWNGDTVISRASAGHFNFGTSLGGQDGWLLAQKMALTDIATGKEVDFDVSTAGALALTSGAWLRFDNTGISQVSTSTIAAGSTAGGGDATVSLGTPGITTTITTSTSGPVALPATSTHNNTGAGGSVTFNLPLSAPTGTTQGVRVVAGQSMVVQAPAGVTVYMGFTASSSGGTWTSNTPGSTATYEYQGSSVWIATSWDGTWTHS